MTENREKQLHFLHVAAFIEAFRQIQLYFLHVMVRYARVASYAIVSSFAIVASSVILSLPIAHAYGHICRRSGYRSHETRLMEQRIAELPLSVAAARGGCPPPTQRPRPSAK